MKINKNDPKLTAFVLKELSEAEMKLVAEQIKNDPELQTEVSRLQANVLQFKRLKVSDPVRLSSTQREKIFSQTEGSTFWKKYYKLASGLAVASLAVVIYLKNEGDLHSSAKQDLAELKFSNSATPETSSNAQLKSEPAKAQQAKPLEVAETPASEEVTAPQAAAPVAAGAAEAQMAEVAKESADNAQDLAVSTATDSAFVSDEPVPKPPAPNVAAHAAKKIFTAKALGGAAGGGRGSGIGTFGTKRESEVNLGAASSMARMKAPAQMAAALAHSKIVKIETDKFTFSLVNLKTTTDSDAVSSILLYPLYSCFENSLSRYVQYNLELNLSWSTDHSKVSNYSAQASVLQGEQKFETELYCVRRKIPSLFKNDPALNQLKGDFTYRLNVRSK